MTEYVVLIGSALIFVFIGVVIYEMKHSDELERISIQKGETGIGYLFRVIREILKRSVLGWKIIVTGLFTPHK